MNRTDRLLALILELQVKGTQRAEDLAATFEISKRTVYRDVQALCEAGVPVVSTPGRGYALVEGYFLPPLHFSVDEAVMLMLGSAAMTQSFDAEYRAAAAAAERKIAAVLPSDRRDAVRTLQDHFVLVNHRTGADELARVQLLRRAMLQRRVVRFRYHARQSDDTSLIWREADPYHLALIDGVWYVTAYDHTRTALRHFRLARMDDLCITVDTFTLPSPRPTVPETTRTLTVRVVFAREAARWAREAPSFFVVAEEPCDDGLLVTLHVRDERDVVPWLLSWSTQVRVLEPSSLRALLTREATAMLQAYQE